MSAQTIKGMPAKSGIAIAAQAKAQLAAQKAASEAQLKAKKAELASAQKALKEEQKALKEASKSAKADSKWIASEALAASANSPYMVENIYKGTSEDWLENKTQQQALETVMVLASIAKAAVKADKAQKELAKAQAKVDASQPNKTPEFENGNLVIQTQLSDVLCDVLNMIADGLSASIASKGKNKGQVIIAPARLDKPTMLKKHIQALETLLKQGYVNEDMPDFYMLTEKGLGVFDLTLQQVKENFLASQA